MDQQTLQAFQSKLNNVTKVLVIVKPNPSFDSVSAMVSLALSLEKMQKKVTLYCSTPLTVEFGNLVGINRIKNEVGNKNLVVTLPGFAQAGVDKVSYNVEGDDFKLTIQPKEGSAPFDISKIQYSFSGVDAELIILIGVPNFASLGDFYAKEKELFDKTETANIDSAVENSNFATFNLTNSAASSCVEIVGYLLQYLKYQVDSDIATNIFYGLMMSTKGLTNDKVRAETYELSGMTLRLGARRIQVMHFVSGSVLQGQDKTVAPQNKVLPTASPSLVTSQISPAQPPPAQPSTVEQPTDQQSTTAPSGNSNPPEDWMQPKIFKGGSLI